MLHAVTFKPLCLLAFTENNIACKSVSPYNSRLIISTRTRVNMKKALHRIASTMLIFGIAAGIAACGGGSASSSAAADTSGSSAIVALKVTDTLVGTGTTAAKNNLVTVHYTGWLYDVKATNLHGTKFDSSIDRGTPFAFTLGVGAVIKGWDQGVEGMKVGGKRTLIIPSSLGYGASGQGSIPGNAALVFDVELLAVQ